MWDSIGRNTHNTYQPVWCYKQLDFSSGQLHWLWNEIGMLDYNDRAVEWENGVHNDLLRTGLIFDAL